MNTRKLILVLSSFLLCHTILGADFASFYGNSYIYIPFKEAKSATYIEFKFKTLLPNALILLVAGTTDFCIVQIERGRLKVNINLGAGESEIVSPDNILFNDFKWHNVSIIRKEANLTLTIDGSLKVQKRLPGRFFELNIHFGLFIGGHANFSELFFGHLEKFRGCISDMYYNNVHTIQEAHHRQMNAVVESVTWNCATEFESDINRPISFVKDNSFMFVAHTVQHKEVKIQFDLKTNNAHGVLFYNTGRLSKPDFFVIHIREGLLHCVAKTGDKIIEISNDFNVTDGEWHKVTFHETPSLLELSVDKKINTTENVATYIFFLTESSYIGGIEITKLSRAMSNGCKYCDISFKGCLRNLFIAHKHIGIPDAHITQGLIPGCVWKYPCKQNPCTENGVCVQHGIESFQCHCNDKLCIQQNYTETYRVFSQNSLATELELLAVKPLEVMEGANAIITTDNLHMILDYQKYGIEDSGVRFHIIDGPNHGTVNVWPQDSNIFTLSEVINDKVHYIHEGLEFFQDNIVVELDFKPSDSFILPAYLQGTFMFNMLINIISVNDPPKLIINNGTVLRVVQGSRNVISNEILRAQDPDTPIDNLVYNVLKHESGYFEYKLQPGVEISSFTQEDVDKGHIYFICRSNAVNDSYISLEVSDGLEASKPYNLRVTVSPQYWRLQNNTGLTLLHQNYGLITPLNLSFVSNIANADNQVQFRITKKPNYGVVETEVTANSWKIVDVFSSSDLKQHRVRYRHITSKPEIDEFQFQITFDKSSLYTFRINFVRCTLIDVNTKPIFMNETQEMMITKQYLSFETKPLKTSSTSIKYVVTKPPKYGIILSSVSKYVLKTCDIFTQEDINSSNLKYRLFQKSYSYVQDTFSFIVISPGCNNITGNMTVIFYPSLDTKSKVMAVLHPLSLDEGSQKVIDANSFNFKTDFLTNVTFNVTQAPSHGFLQLVKDNFHFNETRSFTLTDVKDRRLSYIHDDSENNHDVFKFLALSSEDDFQFVGEYNINIVMKNDNSPIRRIDKIFHVVVGAEKLITGEDLDYSDIDIGTPPSKIVYSCHEIPNGFFYDVKSAKQYIEEFTQEDLNSRRILFKHRGPEHGKIKLWVTDGQFHLESILEVRASAPFIQINMRKKLIVEYGKMAVITKDHLSYFTNLNAGDSDLLYEVISKPSFGKIAATDTLQDISVFSQKDVNIGLISYINDQSSANGDEFSLRANCKDAVTVAQMGVWMLPSNYWEPFKNKGSRKLQVEEATSALITSKILEVSQTDVPPSSITYYVSEIPLIGYLTILSSTNDTDRDIINVFSFTQNLINEQRVLYIQSGVNGTFDSISFNVTNGIIWCENLELKIEIIPERLYLGSRNISVEEGGVAVITPANLFVLTDYYKKKITDYVILQDAQFGCIQVQKRCNKFNGFSHEELTAGVVRYAHDGSENLFDEITLVAVAAQKRSIPVTLKINVSPVNDNIPKLVNNTGLIMWEGGNAVIRSDMLAVEDDDIPKDIIKYHISGSWWGNVVFMSDLANPITFFSQDSIDKGMIGFHHENGSEAKFKFNISDGMHTTQDFYFVVKTNPVKLTIRTKPLHIFPLQRKYLTTSHLISCVSDNNRTVLYEIIVPPSLGRLMMESSTPGIFKVVSSFTQDDINNTKVFYEHTHQFSDLYANDSFVFNVKSHLAKSLTKKILKIDISVSSGGLDTFINIPRLTVDEGGMTNIPLNLSEVVQFLENHSGLHSPIIHVSASAPQYGQLLLKEHNTNFTVLNVFTQQHLESGLVFYHHDHSDSLGDNIHLSLYLIPHYIALCNITIPIIINPINDQPFHLVTPTPTLTLVQGENHTITKAELETEDADTPPSKLKYVVISGPSQGKLILLPDNAPITHFTQEDIDQTRLVYVHNTSVLVDSFHFRVWDDKFRPQFRVFNIKILPINLTISPGLPLYIQQGSDTVFLSSKQVSIETNADRSKIKYLVKREPEHGVLYVRNTPSNQFSQTDLERENVMYLQSDMTTANDSFGLVGEILSGNTSFSSEIPVYIRVQPLMQLKNFTAVTGEYNKITLHVLDASSLAKLTNSNPRYTVLTVPKYCKVKRVIHSSGDKHKVLDSRISSFTHEEVQSGLIYLEVDDVKLPWFGVNEKLKFMLAASIFQPAIGELKLNLKNLLHNNIFSTLAGPSDPAGHEGGYHVASPNMTRDYFLLVIMVTGVVLLGVAVIIVIKCRTFEPINPKEEQYIQPLPRPPDRLMSSSPPLKHHIDEYSPQMPALPQCKITPMDGSNESNGLDSQVCYPYGVEDHSDEWSSCEVSDPPCSNKNIMLRRNQYWV
ncbi:hypothetical protein WA026_010562 [Henosepilachna vigintioctopunctata]|uniref:Laminin G domain-containing protein n=1 Tax=Henosepilachna vigintioctopunctata TaxID=420089 RepID=A0AAW1VEC5_9CUCU